MSDLLSLLILRTNKEYFMDQDEVIVGKLEGCDIQLQFDDFECLIDTISRRHFKITKTRNGFVLTDLLSRNGTKINDSDKLIANRPYFLHDGDVIALAKKDELKLQVSIRNRTGHQLDEHTRLDRTQMAGSSVSQEPNQPKPEPEAIKPPFSFDQQTERFILDGTPIPITYFTELEHDLLHYLYKNAERLCSYNDITQYVWQGWVSSNNIISSAVGRIRRKLNKISKEEDAGKRYIKTKTGFGYMFTLENTD